MQTEPKMLKFISDFTSTDNETTGRTAPLLLFI